MDGWNPKYIFPRVWFLHIYASLIAIELKKLVLDFDLYKDFIDGLLVKHA